MGHGVQPAIPVNHVPTANLAISPRAVAEARAAEVIPGIKAGVHKAVPLIAIRKEVVNSTVRPVVAMLLVEEHLRVPMTAPRDAMLTGTGPVQRRSRPVRRGPPALRALPGAVVPRAPAISGVLLVLLGRLEKIGPTVPPVRMVLPGRRVLVTRRELIAGAMLDEVEKTVPYVVSVPLVVMALPVGSGRRAAMRMVARSVVVQAPPHVPTGRPELEAPPAADQDKGPAPGPELVRGAGLGVANPGPSTAAEPSGPSTRVAMAS